MDPGSAATRNLWVIRLSVSLPLLPQPLRALQCSQRMHTGTGDRSSLLHGLKLLLQSRKINYRIEQLEGPTGSLGLQESHGIEFILSPPPYLLLGNFFWCLLRCQSAGNQ